MRNFGGRLPGEVAYYAPCGKKLRQCPDMVKVSSVLHLPRSLLTRQTNAGRKCTSLSDGAPRYKVVSCMGLMCLT